jgi:hypothetical protein
MSQDSETEILEFRAEKQNPKTRNKVIKNGIKLQKTRSLEKIYFTL